MRNVRSRRRTFIDLARITIGDWIILAAGVMALISLFLPWFNTSTPPPSHSEWAFAYSQVASAVVIVVFLATVSLILYPALSPDFRLPLLPLSTPLIFFSIGAILLLVFTYELGKYACITCPGGSRGFGVWVALISAVVYMVGAVIRWGTRPLRPRDVERRESMGTR